MATKRALHPATQTQIERYTAKPPHAVLLTGPRGSGKRSLAKNMIQDVLNVKDFQDHAYGLTIASDGGKAIGIEAVRELEQFLTLKVPGSADFNRGIIIEDAHLLTTEAQNALLKTLEEPPAGTLLLLTVSHEHALLPTIRSRAQTITVGRPAKQLLLESFNDFDGAAVDKAYAISGGLPGLMHALLHEADHPLAEATEQARNLLRQSTYERLLAVDTLTKQTGLAADTIFILQQMAHVSLQTANGPAARKWQQILTASYEAAEALAASAQPKLVLDNLMLSL